MEITDGKNTFTPEQLDNLGVSPEVAAKFKTENGSVLKSFLVRYVTAIINSFQQLKKVIIATVTIAGFIIGKIILNMML
jgi:hypothetical protein